MNHEHSRISQNCKNLLFINYWKNIKMDNTTLIRQTLVKENTILERFVKEVK